MSNTTVAIKIIKRFSSQKVMEQFENEMTIMTQVSHQNIVRIHGILREGSYTYDTYMLYILLTKYIPIGPFSPALVMEYLPHGNLKHFLSVSIIQMGLNLQNKSLVFVYHCQYRGGNSHQNF